uniref:Sensory neuron membrane protein 2a n=1 Tax=Adelphocoris lineolatus TaxID=236346 RepID=A0A2I4PH01_ADELI|nr:sensory neuron membrane protein 2a [Adelphocoris lineolatus]
MMRNGWTSVDLRMGNIHINRVLYLGAFGAVIFIIGLFFATSGTDMMINSKIKKGIVLEEGSEGLKRFQKTPFPLEFKVFLFNITNTDDVMMGGKPVLTEMGPYTYDLYKEKPELKFLKDGMIEYNMTYQFHFNAQKSRGSESDMVTGLNVPLLGTATMVEQTFPMGLGFLNNAIPFLFPNITDIFVTTTVKDLLFDGILLRCNYTSGPAMPICNGLKGRAPPTIWREEETKNYRFAMFRHKNKTSEGPYKVKTGKGDVTEVGQIVEYQHRQTLKNWDKNSSCTIIKGTDTTIFGPLKNPHDDLYIFVPDVCLSFTANYVNTSIQNGIPLNKYFAAEKNMASYSKDPDNLCRCAKDDEGVRHCLKDGVIDASPCQGAPVIMSNPHFLDADAEYQNAVVGLKPIEEKHKTFVMLEPKTGAPVEGRKRMQMNLKVKKVNSITLLENVTERIIPLLWIEEGTRLEGPLLQELQKLYHVMGLLGTFSWVLLVAGLVIMGIAGVLYLKVRHLFCFAGTQIVAPVDSSIGGAQKMNTFGVTNQGSDDYQEHGYPGTAIYPQLGDGQGKNGDLVHTVAHPQAR